MPRSTRKRLLPHVTTAGRVVYDRPRHQFSEKDALRIIRSLLDNNIENPGAWLGTFLVQTWRVGLTFIRKTGGIRSFVLSFIDDFIPEFLSDLLKNASELGDDLLVSLYNRVVSFLGGMKRSKTLEDLDDN